MKEKLKNKKVAYTIIGIISVLLVVGALTYAYWLVTKTQSGENIISSGCLDIELSGSGDITLSNQFPISDEDGANLTPYTFAVTNNCNTSVDYQVALEATGDEETSISSNALKVALNDNVKLYSDYSIVDTTISNAYESRVLKYGTLASTGSEGAKQTYKLRLWIDEDANISEMNKTFKSKITVTVGQGIESPYAEGTLAYSILANYGGVNATSEIDASEYNYRISKIEGTVDSYFYDEELYFGTEFTYDKDKRKYKLAGDMVYASPFECIEGKKADGTVINCGHYTVLGSDPDDTGSLYMIENWDLESKIYFISYLNPYEAMTTYEGYGIYKTKDDYGTSYYFRGNVQNNYVKFGAYAAGSTANGVTYEEETPMYWRIVRINGDGTIRLIYDGTEKVANGKEHVTIIGESSYNEQYDNPKYVGYTYDTSETDQTQIDSTIKYVLDTWYKNHLESSYEKYISDSIFCNDRKIINTDESGTIEYAATQRYTNPLLTCANKDDRYTVEDIINGNGYLTEPIGLLTLDEALFMGSGLYVEDPSFYLYGGDNDFWTMTPEYYWFEWDHYTNVFVIEDNQILNDSAVKLKYGVRPVINLKTDINFIGNGTIDSPYEIVTN